MLGLSSGLIKGTSVLRSIVKKGLQAWYKADNTQAPLGEEEIANGSFAAGPEVVINGDFASNSDWTSDDGSFVISGGKANATNSTSHPALKQVFTHSNKKYIFTYTISNYSSGSILAYIGGTGAGTSRSSNGTYTEIIQAGGSNYIGFRTLSPFNGSIDNVSVKQTNPNDSWSEVTATGSTVEFKDGTVDLVTDGANVNIQQTILTVGKKYKAEIDFTKNSGAGLKVQDGGGLVIGSISSSGQHSFDFTATNAIFLIARDGSSAGNYTVNSVSVKEITNSVKDFSSNNNNGVLYSGKALIFDGNGDYVDGGLVSNNTTVFTTAFWAKVDNTSSDRAVLQYGKTLVQFNTSGDLQCWPSTSGSSGGNNSVVFSMSNIDTTAWNRYVLIIDGYDISLYVNNDHINTTQTSGPDLITNGEDNFNIGRYEVSREFDGMIADLQIYDKAWTFSDVAYDYNNPDKDVFDNSNSSIVTTDCKALYRLNEGAGDRVYNAAPALGSEMVSNGDFSSIGQELVDNGSFATSSGWGNSDGIWSISGGKASVDTTSSTTLTQTVSVVDNKLYNLSFEISDYVKGNFQVEFGGGKPTQSVSANGVYNYTVSSPATNVILYLYALNESKFSIDNISIKEIEGDWRALEGSNQYLGWSQTGWSIANGKASVDHNNTDLTAMELSKSSFGQVAGRTYSISFEISDYVSGTFQPQFNGQIIAGVTANGVYNYIVSANNTGGSFYLYALSSPKFSVDNVSVKEISLSESYVQASWASSNWITAQPYIPQYAMSSYSKKAIFGGAGSGDYIDCSSDSTIDNIFDDGGTWSVWISGDSDGGNSTGTFLSKGQCRFRVTQDTGDDLTLEFLHLFTNSGSSDNGLWKCPTTALLRNKLNHVAVTYDNSSPSNDPVIYINGVAHTVGGTPALTEGLDPGGTRDTDAGSDLVIGNVNAGSADHYFDGFIDEVAIFDKILTEAEVQEIFNAGMALDCRDHSCYYGDEVLTNGDFSASGLLSDGYQNLGFIEENGLASISNGELSITAASGEVFGSVYATVGNSSRNILEAPGVFYKFTYTITEVSGSQNIEFYSQPGGWTSLTAEQMTVGTHTIILETAGRNFAVRQRTDGSIVKFSSWSVKKIQLNGYWRNNGVDTWVDLSLYGNDGTVNGSPTTIQLQEVPYFKKDTFGLPMNKVRQRALNFDGQSYVEINDDNSLDLGTGSFTIEAWAKAKYLDKGSTVNVIFSLGGSISDTSHNTTGLVMFSTGKFGAYVDGQSFDADDIAVEGLWYHLALRRNSSGVCNLYINGEQQTDHAPTIANSITNALNPRIGADSNLQRCYHSLIDDVRVYNRLLSTAQINTNFKATKSKHKNNIASNWSDDFSDGFI